MKLSPVLDDDCYSPVAIGPWLAPFREDHLSCADHYRSRRPVIDISECVLDFLNKFPFASANMMSKHFRMARGTIMEILQRDLRLKTFSPRWMPHQLITKADHVNRSQTLLHLLQ
jgi:hypothetical protein